ncbi:MULTISPECIES: aminoglycoside N(3)-acetyltransferase [Saliphagus]|uniref:Aminoglycoside N(3)-acetyltransferase n=1 Tax=Saliphagus infecundisoli TaxID=1849069 RepID=A0ABD5QBS5_9EURY|nr:MULTISPECIES: AAC(3) family N-acetyltransferase [Saliphagus]
MSEWEAIERVAEPVVPSRIVADLRALGIEGGETLLVHSSLSAIGWVPGGAPAVLDALQRAVSEAGTLMMPTHSTDYTDPESWSNPPVPDEWIDRIKETMPPYRPSITPTRGMGAIPECFRSYPDVHRSAHPATSMAAWGRDAEAVVADHALDYPHGEDSPLAEIYDRDGSVLLLGVGHDANTSLHLAENRADLGTETVENGAPILADGERVWIEYENVPEDTGDFPAVGEAFEREVGAERGQVGAATAVRCDHRDLVDFATEWFEKNR